MSAGQPAARCHCGAVAIELVAWPAEITVRGGKQARRR